MPIIHLKLDTSREDKGKTANYHVYAAAETFTANNGKGQAVGKNLIMGGNGTLYIGNPVAAGHDNWVLMPVTEYNALMATPTTSAKAPAKSRKK